MEIDRHTDSCCQIFVACQVEHRPGQGRIRSSRTTMIPPRKLRPGQPGVGGFRQPGRFMAGPERGPAADRPIFATSRGDRERANVIIGMD